MAADSDAEDDVTVMGDSSLHAAPHARAAHITVTLAMLCTAPAAAAVQNATAALIYKLQLHKKQTFLLKKIIKNNIQFSEFDLGSCLQSWPGPYGLRLGNYGITE
jgi:hypothetical protein